MFTQQHCLLHSRGQVPVDLTLVTSHLRNKVNLVHTWDRIYAKVVV